MTIKSLKPMSPLHSYSSRQTTRQSMKLPLKSSTQLSKEFMLKLRQNPRTPSPRALRSPNANIVFLTRATAKIVMSAPVGAMVLAQGPENLRPGPRAQTHGPIGPWTKGPGGSFLA